MAELIEVPFGIVTWVGPRNRVLDGGPIPRGEWANFGEMAAYSIGTLYSDLCKNG